MHGDTRHCRDSSIVRMVGSGLSPSDFRTEPPGKHKIINDCYAVVLAGSGRRAGKLCESLYR